MNKNYIWPPLFKTCSKPLSTPEVISDNVCPGFIKFKSKSGFKLKALKLDPAFGDAAQLHKLWSQNLQYFAVILRLMAPFLLLLASFQIPIKLSSPELIPYKRIDDSC
ncbi:hypothetical protein BANRA_01367 [Acinetobacter baumannii]|nr:hypothetical protein BANRA_01367 [Acinetobacter baumannii]